MSQRYGPSIDGDPLLIVTATGAEAIQLPPSFAGGRSFFVRRTDSSGNAVTVSTTSGGSINGATNGTKTVPGNAEVRFIAGDANAWTSIGGATSGGTPGAGTVTSTELATAAVTAGKIASGAVGSTEITDSSVALVDLAGTVQTAIAAAGTAAQKSANLSDLANAGTARTNIGLAGAAILDVGTTAGTVAAGDDSRVTGAAQKSANLSDVASAPTARTNLGLGGTPDSALLAAVDGATLYAYGHSYVAGQAGAARRHYATRLASRLNMTLTNRGVGGQRAVDTVCTVYGGASAWVPGTKGLILLECLINSSRLHGDDTISKSGATDAMRAMMAMFNASAKTELDATSGSVTFGGTWSQSSANTAFSNSLIAVNTVTAATIDIVTPAGDAWIVMGGKQVAVGAGPVLAITDQTASGASLGTLDLSARTTPTPDTPANFPLAWRVPTGARGHTIRFTRTDSTGSAWATDVMLTQSSTPPPVVILKEPYLANYAASVSFPNGSDAVTDTFNALVDTIAGEFSNVIVSNPNTAGYWDKTTNIYSGDSVHPNDKGAESLARTVLATLQANATTLQATAGLGNIA